MREAELRDAAAIARVSVEGYQTDYQGLLPEEHLMQVTYEKAYRKWARAIRTLHTAVMAEKYIYLAESDEGRLIGVVMGGPERSSHHYIGEISNFYLSDEEEEREAIGRELIIRVVERLLVEWAMNSLLIRVLACNTPLHRFCEALGGELVPELEEQVEVEGKVQGLVTYGWRDVSVLLGEKWQFLMAQGIWLPPFCI